MSRHASPAFLAVVVVAFACSGPVPSPSPHASVSPTVEPTATRTFRPKPTQAQVTGWTAVAPFDVGPTELTRIIEFRGRLVAIGDILLPDGGLEPLVVASSDGLVWDVVLELPQSPYARNLVDIAAGELRLVIVGMAPGPGYSLESSAWFSTDGLGWDQAALPDGRTAFVRAVAWQDGTWVAVGLEGVGGPESPSGARIWRSADGKAWVRVPKHPPLESNLVRADAIAAGPAGFIAAGTSLAEPPAFGVVWGSSDGASWSVLSELREFSSPDRLKFVGDRYVGLGFFQAISSGDGRSWGGVATGYFQTTFDLIQVGEEIILVGTDPRTGPLMAVALGGGLDGPWMRQPTEPLFSQISVFSLALAPGGDTIIGVGNSVDGSSVFVLPLP